MITSRERVRTALAHVEPDRVPIDFGSTSVTGIAASTYHALKAHMGLNIPTRAMAGHQLAWVDEAVLIAIQTDTRRAGPVPRQWREWTFPDGQTFLIDANTPIERTPDGANLWTAGCNVKMKMPPGGWFFDYVAELQPLSGDDVTPRDVERYFAALPPLPREVKDQIVADIRRLHREGRFAIVADMPTAVFECWNTRGFETFLLDLAANPELASAFMRIHADYWLEYWRPVLEEAGPMLDIIWASDDLGAQNGPIISMDVYLSLVKPLHRRLWAELKRLCPNARLMIHSDGRIDMFLPHWIELGVEVINPVQYTAQGMDLERLKRDFGRDLVFWGGGCDTQNVLARGTTKQVREEVRRNIEILAPGGGFVFAAVHDIQPGTPVENVLAMFEAAMEYGKY
ncbi:MAG: uroporphyrinogen decarboxylase family protein [Candidatus Sumerlaeia bacterium]